MSQRQLSVTNTFMPRAFLSELKMMFSVSAQRCIVKSKNEDEKHDACWNGAMIQPDPDCTVCGGSGYSFVEFYPRCVIYYKEPAGQGDGAGSFHTQGGKMERVNALMWLLPKDGEKVYNDDIVIFPYNKRVTTPQVEFVAVNKVAYFVFGNRAVVYRYELFKTVGAETVTETGRDI